MSQRLQLCDSDNGPCCFLSPVDIHERWFDEDDGTKVRNLNKNKLMEHLKEDGMANSSGNKKHIQDLCTKDDYLLL